MTQAATNVAPNTSVQALIFIDIRSIDKQHQLGEVLHQLWDATSGEATRPLGSSHGPARFDDDHAARSAYFYWASFTDPAKAQGFVAASQSVLNRAELPAISVVTEPGQDLPGGTIRGTFFWLAQQKKAPGFIP